jgi:glycosyltransferase involved in cell wall biosynthesis
VRLRRIGWGTLATLKSRAPSVLAFPMHGHSKMLSEGYRTRDGHLIEWLGRHAAGVGPVRVASRPEPLVKKILDSFTAKPVIADAPNTTYIDRVVLRLPHLNQRYKWWPDSARLYSAIDPGIEQTPAIIWNPFIGVSNLADDLFNGSRVTVADLLDDWTVHYSFKGISREVEAAYRGLLDRATFVTANSEGTLALAHRFGRSDAILIANGVDPERFSTRSTASGPITVGYVGKLGRRIDNSLIESACEALPDVKFVIAGPVLDGDIDKRLAKYPNAELLGDVHYDRMPALLETFDLGWVPHNVGEGEVGGDVIKTYEYRAAGLPVLSTPIAGVTKRGLTDVAVLPAGEHIEWLREKIQGRQRLDRTVASIPVEATWSHKSEQIAALLGLKDSSGTREGAAG